ncbi:MAG: ATP-binding protein [Bacteroidetes bacterium]|nr:ATP-binding protein [Bacteroidota bacterium]MBU1114917.1 ATP-binding protein [Bacteroidota bacterium]MBU1798392.1 ATP-binding protein [Bacteroidota bacterium]
MDKRIKLEIKLPLVKDIELVAIEGLELMGRHLQIAEEKIGEARILITEGIINAIEHSENTTPFIDVHFIMNIDALVIIITDYGKGFDPSSVENPEIDKKLSSNYKRGWGLKLMREMSDEFKIDSSEKGTKITITKNLR